MAVKKYVDKAKQAAIAAAIKVIEAVADPEQVEYNRREDTREQVEAGTRERNRDKAEQRPPENINSTRNFNSHHANLPHNHNPPQNSKKKDVAGRRPPRKRPANWKGPWPPKSRELEISLMQEIFQEANEDWMYAGDYDNTGMANETYDTREFDINDKDIGHTNNQRPSNREKHEKGDARRGRDRGGEKGDDRRRPPRKRPAGHRGSWSPKNKELEYFPLQEIFMEAEDELNSELEQEFYEGLFINNRWTRGNPLPTRQAAMQYARDGGTVVFKDGRVAASFTRQVQRSRAKGF